MIDDILFAAFQGAKTAGSLLEAELKKLQQEGKLPKEEAEAIAKQAHEALEKRAREARERVGPLMDAARDGLSRVLGVPTRAEIEKLEERLERALAEIERLEKERASRPGSEPA